MSSLSGPFTFQYPAPGASSVLEYQASGLPFVIQASAVDGAATHIHFPFVTKFFTVINHGPEPVSVGFTELGVLGTNKFTVFASGSYTAEIRTIDLYVVGEGGTPTFEVVAGLTQIPDKNFYILTGSHAGFSASFEAKQLVFERGFGYGENGGLG